MAGAESAKTSSGARHALFDRVLRPDAPEALRLGAARGALPIPPQELVLLQIRLLADAAPAVAAAARDSLANATLETLMPLLRDPDCDPDLLDHAARSGRLKDEMLAEVIAHPGLRDSTLEALAESADTDTLALIITNEVRIIENAALLPRLRANSHLAANQRRRLMELERDFIGKAPLGPAPPTAQVSGAAASGLPEVIPFPGPGGPPAEGELPPGGEAVAEGGGPVGEAGAAAAEVPPEYYYDDEAVQRTDAYQRIQRLNVAERSLLAMKGTGEERAILIRDSARTVSQGVLKNPRLSESEICNFAAMRNVHEDILRTIARNPEWTKTYAVAHALVRNPKCPPGLSVQFLGRLGTRDLKIAAADKNVPEIIRRNARTLFLARTQPAKKTFKKAH